MDKLRRVAGWFRRKPKPQTLDELRGTESGLLSRREDLLRQLDQRDSQADQLLAKGKEQAKATVGLSTRQTTASKLSQTRKLARRIRHLMSQLNAQLNIVQTDIHSQMILQVGISSGVPSVEAVTEHAVAAEELLDNLGDDCGVADVLCDDHISAEELEIMKEFEVEPEAEEPAEEKIDTEPRVVESLCHRRHVWPEDLEPENARKNRAQDF